MIVSRDQASIVLLYRPKDFLVYTVITLEEELTKKILTIGRQLKELK